MAKLAGVKWSGLDTFKDELHVLTADLVDESNEILIENLERMWRGEAVLRNQIV